MDNSNAVILAVTGASGSVYTMRLLEQLLLQGKSVYCLFSEAAKIVLQTETQWSLPRDDRDAELALREHFSVTQDQLCMVSLNDWFSPAASGSAKIPRMVICPCSMGCLSSIAQGASNNLIERAADVMIKEGRQLLLLPREMPLSVLHLENMLKLARLGVKIMPASPGFYQKPKRIEDLVDFVVARLLDQLEVPHQLLTRWGQT